MSVSRRVFLGAAAVLPAAAANDRIRLGIIGAGSRGQYLFNEIRRCPDRNVAITAICDVYRPHREALAARAAEVQGLTPRLTPDYRELLGWNDVDAVIIATPDFSHSRILQDAIRRGKDAYCEKPMATTITGARDAFHAVKQSDRVVQIGTQRRSESRYVAAAKLVHSGILGKVTRIDISVNFQEPRWRRDYTQVRPEDLAWPQFLMGRPGSEVNLRRWREWQLFKESTNGIPGLWMSHFADVVAWFMQDPYPATAVANGGVFLWNDGREVEDVFQAALTYPKGFLFTFAMSLTNEAGNRNLWHGTNGTLDADRFLITGAGSRRPERIDREISIGEEPVTSHMADFLDCIRSRRQPRGNIESGMSHAVAGCMAAEALAQGRRIGFDPAKLELV
jgi:predicted dehydrogenase